MPREKQYESVAEKQRAYRARKNESVHFRSRSDAWATPQDLFDQLNEEFGFTLDVAALPENAKCARYFTPKDDGLKQTWEGVCWMNPPYGRTVGQWIAKAHSSAEENGATVVCLLPARTDTTWWHEHIASVQEAGGKVETRFLKGGVKFGGHENSGPFPSVIVVFHGNPLKRKENMPHVREIEHREQEQRERQEHFEGDVSAGGHAELHEPAAVANGEKTRSDGSAKQEILDTPQESGSTRALIPAVVSSGPIARQRSHRSPALSPIVANGGDSAARRFLEFFTVTIRNPHTRRAYYRAVSSLLDFCEERGILELQQIQPMMIAAYIEKRTDEKAAPSVKQELAAIRQMFDYLVTGHIVEVNPAAAVRGPRYSTKTGKTPVLSREEAKRLLESIPTTHIYNKDRKWGVQGVDPGGEVGHVSDVVGLRDRALLALMIFSFARVGAVTKLTVGDYYQNGKRFFVRLHEKGGKFHELPVHHQAEEYIDSYLEAAGVEAGDRALRKVPLFQSSQGRTKLLTGRAMTSSDVLYMIKRRAAGAGLPYSTCCHTFRATGITAYLENGGDCGERTGNCQSCGPTHDATLRPQR